MSKITTRTNKPGYYGKGTVEVAPLRPLTKVPSADLRSVRIGSLRSHAWHARCAGVAGCTRRHEEEKEVKKTVDGKEKIEKKKWKYFELSGYKYLNYVQLKERIGEVARGLIGLGIGTEDVFNIYAATSLNWQLVAHACGSISTRIATAYDTLGPAGLTHSLNEPSCAALFTNAALLPTLLTVLPNTPTVRFIVFDGEPSAKILQQVKEVRADIEVLSMEEVRQRGVRDGGLSAEENEAMQARRPTPETVSCIMYTSGSTGAPKGVVITHANLIASVGAVYTLLGHHLTPEDAYLAYLPLAHILEYIVELIMLFVGMPTGFGGTLTDASVRNCDGDIKAFRPSVMVGVPAVWETIRKGIIGKVAAGGSVRESVFRGALEVKKRGTFVLGSLADSVILSSVRAATGGRLRIAMSGGAAISRETQEFLSVALVMLLQGYGMTESCGMCAIMPPECFRYDTVGLLVPSVEAKLRDVPEAGYFSGGRNGAKEERGECTASAWFSLSAMRMGCMGPGAEKPVACRGACSSLPSFFWSSHSTPHSTPTIPQVCIRGPSVISGYFKRPDLNADETIFAEDGWFRTGDVGQWNADGTLTLIDRIKNLVKLAGGEYIALEQLESTYKACNYVANICVHATAEAKAPIAIIIPHEHNLRAALKSGSGSSSSLVDDKGSKVGPIDPTKGLPDLCNDPRVAELVLKECNAVGKKSGFKAMETLSAVVLTPDEWTPESGLVTAAQKIQRTAIAKKFEQEIKEAYKNQ
ncbi:hypothetical protein K438DRAFT_1982789 [Mycena galopus ATCC 62051]|nr:hypothetical protein K438DRAFT_1982789 [Mycena galopus ATCC 62051]